LLSSAPEAGTKEGTLSAIRTRWAAIGAAVAVSIGGGGLFMAQAADSTSDSAYHPVTPVRVLDTRSSGAITNGATKLKVEGTINTINADGTTTSQEVVPSSASAVAINVTVTKGTKNGDYGFVKAYPCSATTDAEPNASAINFENNVDIANALNVTTSSTGEICLSVYGSANLIVDVAGYYDDSRLDAIEADYIDNDASITMSYSGNNILATALSVGQVDIGANSAQLTNALGVYVLPLQSPYQISTSASGGRYRMTSFSICLPDSAFVSGGYISEVYVYDEDDSATLFESGTLTAASWTSGQCRSFTLSGSSLPFTGSRHYMVGLFVNDSSGTDGDVKISSISATYSPCVCSLALFPTPIFPLETE
jgi:hypothetical protein